MDYSLPIKLRAYRIYIFVLFTYFGYIYVISILTILISLLFAIISQTTTHNLWFIIFIIASSRFPRLTHLFNNKELYKIFLRKDSFRREQLEGREIEYQEIYVNNRYIFRDENKPILAWTVDRGDKENENFIFKIFIFYSLRANKFLVLLAFPEIVFIPIVFTLIQRSSLNILFLLIFIFTILTKLNKLKEDAIYIEGNLRYRYGNNILSIKNISEDVINMLEDIREEKFRNVFGILKNLIN